MRHPACQPMPEVREPRAMRYAVGYFPQAALRGEAGHNQRQLVK